MMSNEAIIIKPLLFQGTLLNTQGNAIPAAKIQLWQTDLNGNYMHSHSGAALSPYSPEYASIISNFQYFGTDETDTNGNFQFLTYRPGIYRNRPYSHFHMKVWLDDPNTGEDTLGLITQFYFSDESGPFPEELQLDVTEVDDTTYTYGSYVNGTIVIGDGFASSTGEELLPVTPKQAEGPYYPTVDFFSMDSDLTTTNDIATDADASTTDPAVGPDDASSPTTSLTLSPSPTSASAGTVSPSSGILQPAQALSNSAASRGGYSNGLVGFGLMIPYFLIQRGM